jgi:hypothetical protein
MAIKKPLVLGANGELEQLQAGDNIEAGSSNQSFSALNSNAGAISIGQAVYVDGAGSVDLAQADAETTSNAIGLVQDASVASGASGMVITDGVLVSADWTTVTGSATLTAGGKYFLSDATAGQITLTPPTLAGSYVVRVGTAISATELEISISRGIKL